MNSTSVILLSVMALVGSGPATAGDRPVLATSAFAAAPLSAVKPVVACYALAKVDLTRAVGATTRITTKTVDTAKGQFCAVTGNIDPTIGFEVYLPVAKWTQRYLQAGCGGLCGTINASIGQAGKCLPATEGEFVVGASDLGHKAQMGAPGESDFAVDPQKRIDFAYRGNHLTALAAKALIRAYYGQAQRYSYFSGCSDGGREGLMEAQRYPDDFDGISVGAPAMLFQIQNSFWHAWTTAANLRADGSRILSADRVKVLHTLVIDRCDALDGVKDGLLGDPRACRPEPAWGLCAEGAVDGSVTSQCLTGEEWAAALRLYAGPTDDAGNRFLPGGAQPGSELQWQFVGGGAGPGGGFSGPPPGGPPPGGPPPGGARTNASGFPAGRSGPPSGGGMLANMSKAVYIAPVSVETDAARFPFTTAQFARAVALHPLNDATDPDLGRFAARGGKLVMYHGWSDTSIAPLISVAYLQAVRRTMGVAAADRVVRLFMLPGVGHCGGGDGFPQIDTLTPLMAWVEQGQAPAVIVADQIAAGANGMGSADGRGAGGTVAPYAAAAKPATASRPIYPYPQVPRYDGRGHRSAEASYAEAPGTDTAIEWYGAPLLTPAYRRDYAAQGGQLLQR